MSLVLDHQAMMILDIQVHCIMQFLYTIQCKPSLLLGKGWNILCTCTYALICRYGDFFPKNAKERVYAIAMMLFTFIFYGLMLGKFANLVASYTFRRQRFKQRFEVIRKYLVSVCSLARMYHQLRHFPFHSEKSLHQGRFARESHQILWDWGIYIIIGIAMCAQASHVLLMFNRLKPPKYIPAGCHKLIILYSCLVTIC